jgi:prepilin-type processing-associated H-X9-DG protein
LKDRDLDAAAEGLGSGTGNGGGDIIYRTREGVERFMITDINNPAASAQAQSEVPIMMDTVTTTARNYNHVPGGGNVLYMDGHVSFIRYPGEYPISEEAAGYIAYFNF